MLTLMWSRWRYGARFTQPPDGQKIPTLEDMKELSTSGTLPERGAPKILSSLIPPTTLTFTAGCFWSYSATTFLNSVSSCPALQPTQIVMVVAFWAAFAPGLLEAAPTEAATTPAATSASTTSPVATRFIPSSLRLAPG